MDKTWDIEVKLQWSAIDFLDQENIKTMIRTLFNDKVKILSVEVKEVIQ